MHVCSYGEEEEKWWGGETTNMLMTNAGERKSHSVKPCLRRSQGSGRAEMASATELPIWSCGPAQSVMENFVCFFFARGKETFFYLCFFYLLHLIVAANNLRRRMGKRLETESQIKSASFERWVKSIQSD